VKKERKTKEQEERKVQEPLDKQAVDDGKCTRSSRGKDNKRTERRLEKRDWKKKGDVKEADAERKKHKAEEQLKSKELREGTRKRSRRRRQKKTKAAENERTTRK